MLFCWLKRRKHTKLFLASTSITTHSMTISGISSMRLWTDGMHLQSYRQVEESRSSISYQQCCCQERLSSFPLSSHLCKIRCRRSSRTELLQHVSIVVSGSQKGKECFDRLTRSNCSTVH